MKIIKLSGYVGWEIKASELERQLPKDGSDAMMKIDSYGGSVYEANRLYNVILDHVKNENTGKLSVEFGAIAASAASYFPLAVGVENIGVRENTTFMGHKAWAFMLGNADELREEAEILDGFDLIIAKTYSRLNGLKTSAEYLIEMSKEMWFIGGQKVIDAGFASFMVDKFESSDDPEEDEIIEKSVILAKIEEGKNKLRENGVKEDLKKWAACIKTELVNISKSAPLKADGNIKTEEFENMKINEFLEKNPEAKAEHVQILATAKTADQAEAVKGERERVSKLLNLSGTKLPEGVKDSIDKGESLNEFMEREIQARNKADKEDAGEQNLGSLTPGGQVPEGDKDKKAADRFDAIIDKRLGKKKETEGEGGK